MEEAMRRTRTEQSQWFSPRADKDDKRPGIGSGALHFIRNRGSMRRQLMRDSNRAKRPDEQNRESPRVDSAGGGFGKWLKEHLKGSSGKNTCVQDNNNVDNSSPLSTPLKTRGLSGNGEKVISRGIYTPQNVYCSLPREHRRHSHDSGKINNEPSARERSSRSGSCHPREKSHRDGTGIARGGVYGSEGKSYRRKNREKRRHSMNETREHRSYRRKSCVPNGGAACSAMTELQPSPAGYRGQDEVPGPPTHPVAFGKSYPSHGHIETCNYSIPGYLGSQAHAGSKQQPLTGSRGSSPGDNYRRKSDRWTSENDSNLGDNAIATKTAITGYNEGYGKKNTPGYKNDSGYSESIGFDSYSLPFNEADEASPPPTPPVRDASSLKGVCCGPGHEKYPSWPSTASEHHHHHQHYPDNDIDSSSIDLECSQSGSHRSKSWTDDTNYSKDKPAQYSRPLAKRPNPTFTQQLKTVMERCEKIPTENYESRGSRTSLEDDQTRLWPCVDRESNSLGATDPEYVVAASPSDRDQHQHQHQHQQQPQHQKQSPQTLSHADLEAYVRNYHDPQVSQVDIYRETALTQAGLEEYTRVQHSQQASYAQSEGYHSYVSSVDSTTNTPFLDRLRRDSEAVAQRAAPSWEETSREGRDSVVTTSSGGSASSSETLKWHGSMSDVSISSGLPTRQVNGGDVWPHGSMSDVSSINGSGIQKHTIPHDSDHDKWQGSMSDVSSSLMISSSKLRLNNINNNNNSNNNNNNNSNNNINSNGSISMKNNDNKWQENKWQATMNDRNCKQISSRTSLPSVISHYASVNDVCQASSGRDVGKWQESSIDEETLDKSKGIQRGWESCINVDQARYNHNSRPIPQSSMSQSQTQAQTQSQSQSQTQQQHNSDDWNPLHGSMSDVSQANISIHSSSKQLIAHSARVQTPQRHHSESVLYLDRERTLRKLYPVSTSQRDEPGQTRISPVSPQQPHLSVAERINELEKQQQQMRYTYLDPEKRHRVSDPTLKAIQKKALLSYYERHHQSSWRSEPQLAQGAVPPQSPPPQPPPRPRPPSSRRASSASDYASISWREKTSPSQGQRSCDLPSPKHQHSNSCGSLSTDLLGPVIVGPAISIDDWVPERPPKKPHLRAVYDSNNRVPSPDLPPPSPPTVTESEVLNCDEPLPPPPPPLNEPEAAKDQEEKRQSSSSSSSSSRRSSKQSKKVETNSATNGSKPQFIRATPLNLEFTTENVNPGFATHRVITGRSSLRYPSAQKLSVTRRTSEELTNNSSRPPARLPELSPRYSHPVESRIIRQESMRVESTRVDASGLIKMEDRDRVLESSTGQRPQPQVPKTGLEKTSSGYSRPNYLALSDCNIKNGKYSEAMGYTVAPGVKTSYEANAKLLEGSPQKYHDPPKYVGSNQRNYYVLPSKFSECEKFLTSPSSPPPPLAPRQSCGRKSLAAPPRPAPPSGQGSQSKASYLAYKRERGAPDSEGSYKRTMSPTARLEDWPPPRDRDDPVLLRVTPHHPLHNNNHINNNNNNNNHNNNNSSNNNNTNNSSHNDLPKSHSVDALHHRIEERTNAHSVEVMGKLSHELSKKLQASDTRPRSESNNNILNNNNHNNINNNHNNNNHDNNSNNNNSNNNNNNSNNNNIKRDLKERVSPQSVQVLNDRNRQLERERRKLAANCEAIEDSELLNCETKNGIEDFYCERSATIEMTSKNVELLNRRNILPEKRHSTTGTTTDLDHDNSLSSTSTSTSTSSSPFADKSPPTTSPRFAKMHKNEEVQLRSRGAVPRRSGSCSSSSSSRSSLEQGLTHSRSSPAKIYSNNLQNREHRKSLPELENVKESYPAPRSKVSSPAQTESSWMKLGASQTDTLFTSRLRRSPSSGSRSSSLSSASKISSSSSSLSPRYSPIEGKSSSPCVSPQPGIEGLTLMQRTEVILRVNTTTMDVASQTEALDEEEPAKEVTENTLIAEPRRKLPEEIECEKLSRDLASQLGPNDKLVTILVPVPELKKPTDYMSGLFRVETTLQPRPRRLVSIEPSLISTATENGSEDRKNEMPSTPNNGTNNTTSTNNNNNTEPSSPVSPTSTYLMTSEGKARFLTQYSQDIGDVKVTNGDTPSNSDSDDLKQKKEELVMRLDRKVVVLKAEQEAVREEGEMNETLGAKIASRVAAVAQSAEASKYKLHVEEVGMITNLLVVLSGRLARAENALHGMPANHSERKILEAKRDQLLEQLHDAKVLKINIDKRSVNVSAILSKYLNNEEFADYQHFITMKTKLIMDGREIQDKVKLGEEQLAALKEAIG